MAYKKLAIGGLQFFINANPSGMGFGFSLHGPIWDKFAKFWLKNQQEQVQETGTSTRSDSAEILAIDPEYPIDHIWYHTFDFGNGIKSNGVFDHAPILHKYKLPKDLSGKRVLDVATFDGYWAMEFERRGADEVIALDLESVTELDWAPKLRAKASEETLAFKFGRGFEYARKQFNSKVKRVTCNVYDLEPERFGSFDIVHVGDVLLHLKSPVKALQNIASVCTDYAIISDVYIPELDRFAPGAFIEYKGAEYDYTWWKFSLEALQRMILDAGFSRIELVTTFKYGQRDRPEKMNHAVIKAYK